MIRKPAALIVALFTLLAVPAIAADYEIDGMHSSVVYRIKHFGVSNFYGVFGDVSGNLKYDAANVGASSIEISIKADSVQSRSGRRDEHIKSPDFLNAKQFPVIKFTSKSVKAKGDKLEIVGDLLLHGVTREITVMGELTGEGTNPRNGSEMIGFEARFEVDRTEHDMNFMAGPLSKEIGMIVSVEAVKK